MNVSREFAIGQLKAIRNTLDEWIGDLEKPMVDSSAGVVEAYRGGVPAGLSVSSLDGIPVDQLRSELLAMAGIMETVATS